MQLTFESFSELNEFMQFACHLGAQLIGAQPPAAPVTAPSAVSVQPTVTDNGGSVEPATSSAGDPADTDADSSDVDESASTADKPRRKRRTKAEMEAARAAADDMDDAAVEAAAPFDPISAVQAIQSQLQPAPAPEPADVERMHRESLSYRARLIAQIEPERVESLPYLRECQAFIQKFGMPKYNESFREGLAANITTFSPEQRALHLAILESLSE